MSAKPIVLVETRAMPSGRSVIYTAPGLVRIGAAVVTSASSSDVAVTFEVGSSDDGLNIVKAHRLRPGESYVLPELAGQVLSIGQMIIAQCDSGNAAVVRISGLEIA